MLMPTRISLLKDSLRRRCSCYDRSNSTFIQILHHQRNEKPSIVGTCGWRNIVDQSPFKRSFSQQQQQQKWSEIMSSSSDGGDSTTSRPVWSEEWKRLGLGAKLLDEPNFPSNLFFVQVGFGIDQHGNRSDATKASIRAVRNAIEFNSIPGVIQHIPGGRNEMLIHVKLGVPQQQKQPGGAGDDVPTNVDVLEVAKVFPYGKLLPIEIVNGGLDFPTGRIVEELGDTDDIGICVCACVSIGYDDNDDDGGKKEGNETTTRTTSSQHKTFNTKDGY